MLCAACSVSVSMTIRSAHREFVLRQIEQTVLVDYSIHIFERRQTRLVHVVDYTNGETLAAIREISEPFQDL